MKVESGAAGIPTGWLVCIILVILKATGTIGMSWFWVITSVIWAPLGIIILILFVVGILTLFITALGG